MNVGDETATLQPRGFPLRRERDADLEGPALQRCLGAVRRGRPVHVRPADAHAGARPRLRPRPHRSRCSKSRSDPRPNDLGHAQWRSGQPAAHLRDAGRPRRARWSAPRRGRAVERARRGFDPRRPGQRSGPGDRHHRERRCNRGRARLLRGRRHSADLPALRGPPPRTPASSRSRIRSPAPPASRRTTPPRPSPRRCWRKPRGPCYQSGLLCISLDSYDIAALTNGAFAIDAGVLMDFDSRLRDVSDRHAPLQFSIHAPAMPSIRIGAGGEIADGVNDPLIELRDRRSRNRHRRNDRGGLPAALRPRRRRRRTARHRAHPRAERSSSWSTTSRSPTCARSTTSCGHGRGSLLSLLGLIINAALDALLGDNLRFPIDFTQALDARPACPSISASTRSAATSGRAGRAIPLGLS